MFATKMTPEAKEFAMVRLACDTPARVIKNELKQKFDIDISLIRIRALQKGKIAGTIYDQARSKYLQTIQKSAAKYINQKDKRQVILENLLEEIISTDPNEYSKLADSGLKERAELALKVLKAAKDEDVSIKDVLPSPRSSLTQFVQNQVLSVRQDGAKNEVSQNTNEKCDCNHDTGIPKSASTSECPDKIAHNDISGGEIETEANVVP